jgi:radical SAM superfamily enzyme YgiQ (UPF0313 family)
MVAAVLENTGHQVRAVDAAAAQKSRQDLLADVEREPPDAVVWAAGTPSIADDLALADELKAVAPNLKTAVFGTHVTVLDRSSMEEAPGLDAILRNEPEETAAEWVARLETGESWDGVAGLTYRNGSGIARNPDRPFLADLDGLPDPAWHLFDLSKYRLPLKGSRFLMVGPHRGCPYPCSYCTAQTYYGAKLRRRSVKRVVAEIERDVSRYGVREFFFWADTFTLDRRYVTELCRALRPLDISWAANSRVDTMDEELAELMRRAGCWMVSFGIESGEQALLDEVGKKATVEDAVAAVRVSKKARLKVAGHFVLGIPGETGESLEKTLDLARRLPLDFAQFYCAVPFPGSRLYEKAKEKGWLGSKDFSRYRQDEAVLALPTVQPEQVMVCRQRAYRGFYLRPRVAFGALSLVSPRFLKRLAFELRRFLDWTRLGRWLKTAERS